MKKCDTFFVNCKRKSKILKLWIQFGDTLSYKIWTEIILRFLNHPTKIFKSPRHPLCQVRICDFLNFHIFRELLIKKVFEFENKEGKIC
jgi:hypothetical protein